MNRRKFLKMVGLGGGAVVAAVVLPPMPLPQTVSAPIPVAKVLAPAMMTDEFEVNMWGSYVWGTYRPAAMGVWEGMADRASVIE